MKNQNEKLEKLKRWAKRCRFDVVDKDTIIEGHVFKGFVLERGKERLPFLSINDALMFLRGLVYGTAGLNRGDLYDMMCNVESAMVGVQILGSVLAAEHYVDARRKLHAFIDDNLTPP